MDRREKMQRLGVVLGLVWCYVEVNENNWHGGGGVRHMRASFLGEEGYLDDQVKWVVLNDG